MSQSVVLASTYSIRSFLLGKIALPAVLLYRNLFKGYKSDWGENRETLKAYPEGSTGRALSDFLYTNNIDLERKMENHDFFHVVLGYDTSLPEEAALHFFLIGNGKRSHYPIIAAFIGFLFFPEYYELYIDAYHRGRCSKPFVSWHLKKFLHIDLERFQKSAHIPQRIL